LIGIGEAETSYPYGAIYYTRDGGENWILQQEFPFAILDMQMLNQDTGWAVGGDYIYYTTNGSNIVDINENYNIESNVSIIPNPSNGILTILVPEEISNKKIIIYNLEGKEITKTQSSKHITIIDISKQPNGIYFLTIHHNTNNQIHSFTKKIIKL